MEKVSPAAVFRINTPKITHQTIDGESIIIDFDSGSYFSTAGVGAAIWEEVAQNAVVSDIVSELAQRYTGDITVIQQAVEQFLLELQRETLIVLLDNPPTEPRPAYPSEAQTPAARPAFQAPTIDKYIDMQDLLLLDPIHDVDEQGWPMKKETTSE